MMSDKIKNFLGLALVLGVLVVSYGVWKYTADYSLSAKNSAASFTVSAEGKVSAPPDIAQFTFSVINQGGKEIANLQKENVDQTNKVIDFVKSKGVDAKDIKTLSYNVDPRYSGAICPPGTSNPFVPTPCPAGEILGYTVSQAIEVKVRDFGKVGDLLSGVVQNGANNVSQLSFTVDDPAIFENQARAKAIEKAKTKAEDIAKFTGFKLGDLLNVYEERPYTPYLRAQSLAGGGAVSPSVQPGSQEVTVNVTLRYEIK